ncbi:bifunctional adenosylcobinamide kinase/adenosylcobinamide-phosphate guanylyltransferase [Bacillus sp. 2205SS5-2]|uniref:bifunctional adenosylcobinamide kinase/adenosylcobinamide-phosphate guanylyltransferase n=1 Tax=Bacillus sp. 2205SS5-2 TaxID=3109031 RepID=UPI003005DD19
MIVFVSGGARSGKSTFAERMALDIYNKNKLINGRLFYLATAKRSDEEMDRRIFLHQKGRGKVWEVLEEPYDLDRKLGLSRKGDVVLLDCLTIWLSNMMFDRATSNDEILDEVAKWTKIVRKKDVKLFIVSNAVNEELPSKYDSVKHYVYLLEKLHQLIVEQSDVAIQVRSGIPKYWKGGEVIS